MKLETVIEGKVSRCVAMITVRKAKNDQERKGSVRPVTENPEERLLCVCFTLRRYLAIRDPRNPKLFSNPRIPDAAGARGFGPELASATPAQILRKRLLEAGMPLATCGRYASNSLRKGGATRAFSAGVSKLTIKRHGNWKSDAVAASQWPSTRAVHFGGDLVTRRKSAVFGALPPPAFTLAGRDFGERYVART